MIRTYMHTCTLTHTHICAGFKPGKDDSQWWGRRDALCRSVAAALWASEGRAYAHVKECCLLFDDRGCMAMSKEYVQRLGKMCVCVFDVYVCWCVCVFDVYVCWCVCVCMSRNVVYCLTKAMSQEYVQRLEDVCVYVYVYVYVCEYVYWCANAYEYVYVSMVILAVLTYLLRRAWIKSCEIVSDTVICTVLSCLQRQTWIKSCEIVSDTVIFTVFPCQREANLYQEWHSHFSQYCGAYWGELDQIMEGRRAGDACARNQKTASP